MSHTSSNLDSTLALPQGMLIERFQLSTSPCVILAVGSTKEYGSAFISRYCEERIKQDPNHLFAQFSSWRNKITLDDLKGIIEHQKTHKDRHISVIIDGIVSQDLRGLNLSTVAANSSFYRISLIVVDPCIVLPSDVRCNADYTILWPNANISTLKRVYEHSFWVFPAFAVFDMVVKEIKKVKDDAALVTSLKGEIFWYSNSSDTEYTVPSDNILKYSIAPVDSKILISKAIELLDSIKEILRTLG